MVGGSCHVQPAVQEKFLPLSNAAELSPAPTLDSAVSDHDTPVNNHPGGMTDRKEVESDRLHGGIRSGKCKGHGGASMSDFKLNGLIFSD